MDHTKQPDPEFVALALTARMFPIPVIALNLHGLQLTGGAVEAWTRHCVTCEKCREATREGLKQLGDKFEVMLLAEQQRAAAGKN